MKLSKYYFFLLVFFVGCASPESTKLNKTPQFEAAVSTVSEQATQVGIEILKSGGNAFDAAVAVHFALAVTYPEAGNIGGGGFTVFLDELQNTGSIDFREKAPLKATENMYLNTHGEVVKGLSLNGGLAAGVPGSVHGMWELHKNRGKLPWAKVIAPAVELAKKGFKISRFEADKLNQYNADFKKYNHDSIPFAKNNWQAGDTLKQPALANTLQLIADSGAQVFYFGGLAKKVASDIEKNGGIITTEDLNKYTAIHRDPIKTTFKDYEIISMPPPSSGGVALIQLLNGIEKYIVNEWGHNSAQLIHMYAEIMRRVYADRTTFLGDPEFYPVPTENLTKKSYLDDRFTAISEGKATPSSEIKAGKADRIESYETTHYSIVDEFGNAVSTTTTLNGNYGSKVWLKNVGFFLNNQMDDFSVKAGVPNQFGLLGGMANAIEPEKRMLSSMTPTIVTQNNKPVFLVGSPGGSTIITSVFQTIMNVLVFDMPLQKAIDAPRMHHQWQPDHIVLEDGKFNSETIEDLKKRGHEVILTPRLGMMNCIYIDKQGNTTAAGDITRYDGHTAVIENE